MRASAIAVACLLAVSADAAVVEIRIVDAAQRPVRGGYIGIATGDALWSSPTAESLTGDDGIAQFDVPEGDYRIVAGAPGYWTDFERAITAGPGGATTTIRLASLGSVSGRILNAEGDPVRDARIGMYWEFLADHPHALSKAGRTRLRSNTFVRSDDDGLFELPLPPDRPSVVIIEADGMSPAAVDRVTIGSAALREVVLQRGAHVRVSWAHGFTPQPTDVIALSPVDVQLSRSLPRHRAAGLWQRSSQSAEWTSLPTGTFDVLLHRQNMRTPIVLRRVTVIAGEQRTIEVAAPPASQTTATVKRRLFLHDGNVTPPVSAMRWRSQRETPLPAILERTEAGDVLVIDSDCEAGDRIVVTAGTQIGMTTIGDCASPNLVVPLRQRAELFVRFAFPRGARLPATAAIEGFDCASNTPVSNEFAIRDNSSIVPFVAGCTAATLRVRGFMPVATGRIVLKPGERRELPPFQLQPARAILARVTAADGQPAKGARVLAVRSRELADVRSMDAIRALPPIASAVAGAEGWARIPDLPNEPVTLVVFDAGRQLPQLSGPHEVLAGEERIEEIVIRPHATARISLEGDESGTEVIPSSAILRAADESSWPHSLELQARFGADSTAVFEFIPDGAWIASALVRAPGGTVVAVGRERIDAPPGANVVRSIALDKVTWRGSVTRGEKPLDGMLSLRPTDRTPSAPAQSATVRDGRFVAILERGGEFRASMEMPGGRHLVAAAPVVFRDRDQDVVIRFGDARISGRVQTPAEDPAAETRVSAVAEIGGARREAQAFTREDGTFEIDGLEAGRWLLRASAPSQRSDATEIAVAESQTVAGVILRLRNLTTLNGRVRHADGTPAVHAIVAMHDDTQPGAESVLTQTNEQGELTLDLPSVEPVLMNVGVLESDGSVSAQRLEIHDRFAIILPVAYGIARIHNGDESLDAASLRGHVLVADDGAWISVLTAGRIENGTIVLSRLAAGRWRYVVAADAALLSIVRSGNGVTLAPRATFVIDASTPTELNFAKETP